MDIFGNLPTGSSSSGGGGGGALEGNELLLTSTLNPPKRARLYYDGATDVNINVMTGGGGGTYLPLDGSQPMTGNLDMGANTLTNVDSIVKTGPGPLNITGSVYVNGTLDVVGPGNHCNAISMGCQHLIVATDAHFQGTVNAGNVTVDGPTELNGTLTAQQINCNNVTAPTSSIAHLTSGIVDIGDSLNVEGTTTLNGPTVSSRSVTTSDVLHGGTLHVDSTSQLDGNVTLASTARLDAPGSTWLGNTLVRGPLVVNGNSVFEAQLQCNDQASFHGRTELFGPVFCTTHAEFNQDLQTPQLVAGNAAITTQNSTDIATHNIIVDTLATIETAHVNNLTAQNLTYGTSTVNDLTVNNTLTAGNIVTNSFNPTSIFVQDLHATSIDVQSGVGTLYAKDAHMQELAVTGSTSVVDLSAHRVDTSILNVLTNANVVGNLTAGTLNVTGTTTVDALDATDIDATNLSGSQCALINANVGDLLVQNAFSADGSFTMYGNSIIHGNIDFARVGTHLTAPTINTSELNVTGPSNVTGIATAGEVRTTVLNSNQAALTIGGNVTLVTAGTGVITPTLTATTATCTNLVASTVTCTTLSRPNFIAGVAVYTSNTTFNSPTSWTPLPVTSTLSPLFGSLNCTLNTTTSTWTVNSTIGGLVLIQAMICLTPPGARAIYQIGISRNGVTPPTGTWVQQQIDSNSGSEFFLELWINCVNNDNFGVVIQTGTNQNNVVLNYGALRIRTIT